MNYAEIILVFFLIWQISSMPLPAWFASAFFGIDQHAFSESKQFSENHFAHQNKFWAMGIFALEFVKGFAAISLTKYLPADFTWFGMDGILVAAIIVVLGHTFSIYSEFSRSKSIGTYLGLMCGLAFLPGIIALFVFVLTWALLKKVSIITYLLAVLTVVCLTFTIHDVQLLLVTAAIGVIGFGFLHSTTTAPTT